MKSKLGPWLVWTIGLLVIPLWFISFMKIPLGHDKNFYLNQTSEIFALCGSSLFALTFILSSKLKWLECFFGGLDKMYHTHHTVGKTSFLLLLAHPILLALRWFPHNMTKVAWYLFPVHKYYPMNIGSVAWWILIVLVILTLANKLPYDKWKITHKFMGVVLILGIMHTFAMDGMILANSFLLVYFFVLFFLAISAYLYKSILFSFMIKHYFYRIEKIERLNDKVMEITLIPQNEKLTFVAGQYCFFSFINSHFTREAHPFTVCSPTKNDKIQLVVKARGDFTENLYRRLEPNILVSVEGPYGLFDYRLVKKDQVWIGGGVGVAPFISWLRSIQENKSQDGWNIDFYYCVNTQDESIHYDEFRNFEKKYNRFKFHLISADREGFLKASDIPCVQTRGIFICGPKDMRRSLLQQLHALHVPTKQIHYEDFDFL